LSDSESFFGDSHRTASPAEQSVQFSVKLRIPEMRAVVGEQDIIILQMQIYDLSFAYSNFVFIHLHIRSRAVFSRLDCTDRA